MFIDLFEEGDAVITTERLTLRLMEQDDAKDIFEIRGDADTACDAGVDCMKSIEEARNYIQCWWEDSAVIVLGEEVIGLIESYTDPEWPFNSTFLGYYMKKEHRNNGYMTEALTALKEKGIEIGFSDLMLWTFPDNDASKRVAIKCGWVSIGCHLVDVNGYNQFLEFFI